MAEYLEGDLALDKRATVDAHLDGCPDCAREVDQMRQTIRLLHALPDPEPPPMLAADIMRRVRAGEAEPSWMTRITRVLASVLEPTFVLPASAVAVAALVVMVIQQPGTHSPLVVDDSGAGLPLADSGSLSRAGTRFEADLAGLELDMSRAFRGAPSASPSSSGGSPKSALSTARIQITVDRDGARIARISPGAGPSESIEMRTAAARARDSESDSFRYRREIEAKAAQRGARAPSAVIASRVAPLRAQERPHGWSAEESSYGEVGRAQHVARSVQGGGLAPFPESSGGGDARDEWLSRGLEDPVGFARFIADKNLAEQELWVARLTERAQALGLLTDLVKALRGSGDSFAAILGDDFAAQAQADVSDEAESGWEAPFQR
jgi:hypothetical protein